MSATRTKPIDPADPGQVEHDGLCDEQGPIPVFGPVRTDEQGRIVLTDEERAARRDAAIRMLRVLGTYPDTDPPGTDEAFMRGIDENRPHRPLFEGMY
jgi:hypothetical protein